MQDILTASSTRLSKMLKLVGWLCSSLCLVPHGSMWLLPPQRDITWRLLSPSMAPWLMLLCSVLPELMLCPRTRLLRQPASLLAQQGNGLLVLHDHVDLRRDVFLTCVWHRVLQVARLSRQTRRLQGELREWVPSSDVQPPGRRPAAEPSASARPAAGTEPAGTR